MKYLERTLDWTLEHGQVGTEGLERLLHGRLEVFLLKLIERDAELLVLLDAFLVLFTHLGDPQLIALNGLYRRLEDHGYTSERFHGHKCKGIVHRSIYLC